MHKVSRWIELHGMSDEQLVESLLSGERSLLLINERIDCKTMSVSWLMGWFSARLHRGCSPVGWQNLTNLLAELCLDETVIEAVLKLVEMFPDLFMPLSSLLLKNNRDLLMAGLASWSRVKLTSPLLSMEVYEEQIVSLLLEIGLDAEDFAVEFLAMLDLGKPSHLSSMVVRLCARFQSSKMEVAIIELVAALKENQPSFDCCAIIEALKITAYPDLLLGLVASQPSWFSAEEMLIVLTRVKSTSWVRKRLALAIVADYPCYSGHEAILEETILSDAEGSIDLKNVCSTLKTPYLIQLAAGLSNRRSNHPLISFLLAFDPSLASTDIVTLIDVVRVYPELAQRALLLFAMALQQKSNMVPLIRALIKLSRIDRFCQERATAIISSLVPLNRSVLFPLFAKHLDEASFLFQHLQDHLTLLLHSGSYSAFAMTVFRLTRYDQRQSHLSLALRAIQTALRSCWQKISILDQALMVTSLERLVSTAFVSPVLIWKEFIEGRSLKRKRKLLLIYLLVGLLWSFLLKIQTVCFLMN